MLEQLIRLPVAVLLISLTACAVGNRYDYTTAVGALPVSGQGAVAVSVVDARPYVVSGEKTPDFVGLQRGGFGNPFDVRTGSGRPLADEMRDGIANALQKQGYTTAATGAAAPRRLELRVLEWKTDVMARMKVLYDLRLSVFDGQGQLLAQSKSQGEDVLGGGLEKSNAVNAAKSFELHLTELMRDEKVKAALSGSLQ